MRRFLTVVGLSLCFPLAWWAGGATADLIVHVRDRDGKVVASVAVPPGGYADVIERGTTPTPPGPNPQPPNPQPPDPQPPNPIPIAKGKYLLLIRNDAPGAMTSAQLAALADANLRAQITAAGLLYSEFPVDSAAVQQPPPAGRNYQKSYLTPNNLTAPCLVLADAAGRYIRGTALPADAVGIMAFVNGGK